MNTISLITQKNKNFYSDIINRYSITKGNYLGYLSLFFKRNQVLSPQVNKITYVKSEDGKNERKIVVNNYFTNKLFIKNSLFFLNQIAYKNVSSLNRISHSDYSCFGKVCNWDKSSYFSLNRLVFNFNKCFEEIKSREVYQLQGQEKSPVYIGDLEKCYISKGLIVNRESFLVKENAETNRNRLELHFADNKTFYKGKQKTIQRLSFEQNSRRYCSEEIFKIKEEILKNHNSEERIYKNSINSIMRNMGLTKDLRINEYEKRVEDRVADIREINTSKISTSNISNSKINTGKIVISEVTELDEQFFKYIAEKLRWTNSKKIQRETETLNLVKYGTRKESTEERIYQLYFKNKYDRREQELKSWTIEEKIYRSRINSIMRNMKLTKDLRINEYEKSIEERVADIWEIKNSKISASKINNSNIKNDNISTSKVSNNNIKTCNIKNSKIITSKVMEIEEQFFKYIAEKVRWTNSKKIQRETEILNLMKYGIRKESTEERIYQLYFKNKYGRHDQELKNWAIEEKVYRNSIDRIMRNMKLTKELRVNEYEKFLEERVADIWEIKNSKMSASKISDSNIKIDNTKTSNISNCMISNRKMNTSKLKNNNINIAKMTELDEQLFKHIAEKVRWTNSEKNQRETLNLLKYGTRKESTEERIYQLYFKNKYDRCEQELKNWTIEERIYRNSINSIMRNMELTKDLRINEYEKFIEERADIREIKSDISTSKISNSNIKTSKKSTSTVSNSNIKISKIITSKVTELEEQFFKYIVEKVRWTNSKKNQRETLNLVKYGTRKESTEERIYQLYFKNKYGRHDQELKNWTIEEKIYRNSIDRIIRSIGLTKDLRVNGYEKFIEERVADIREIKNSKISASKISDSNIKNDNIKNDNIKTRNISTSRVSNSNKKNSKIITSKVMELEKEFFKYIAAKIRGTSSKKNQRETEILDVLKYGTRKESTEEQIHQLYFKNKYGRREQELKNWTIEERIYRNSINSTMRNIELTKNIRGKEYVKEELEAIVNQLFLSNTKRVGLKTYSNRGLKEISYTSKIDYEEMNPSTEYINKFSQPLRKYKIAEIRIEKLNNQTIEKKIYAKTLKQILSNIKTTRNIDGKVSEAKIIEEALKIYKHLKGDKIINQDFIETRNRNERNERLLQTIIEQASSELKDIKKRKHKDYRVLEDEKKSEIIKLKFRGSTKEILNSNYFVEHKETNIYKNITARSKVEELVQKFSLENKLMYRKLNFENQIFKKIIQRDVIGNMGETTSDMTTTPRILFAPNSTSGKSEGVFQLLLKNILKNKPIISLTKVSEIRKLQNEKEHNLYKHLKADNKLIIFSDTLKRDFLNEVTEKYHTFENKLKTELILENKNEETKTAMLAIEKNLENEIANTTNYKMIKNVKCRKINRGNIDNANIIMGSKVGVNSQSTINQVLKEELIDSTVMEFKKQIAHKKTEGTPDNNKSANDYEEIVKRLENEKATLTSSQIDDLVEEIYWKLEKRIRFERQRAGL